MCHIFYSRKLARFRLVYTYSLPMSLKNVFLGVSLARSFWAAKSDFCSIMQKFLHDEKKFLQPKNFFNLCQNSLFYTTFDIQSFWKVHEMGFKNFCMVRENFCRLQKSAPLILQPRKTPLVSHLKIRKNINIVFSTEGGFFY